MENEQMLTYEEMHGLLSHREGVIIELQEEIEELKNASKLSHNSDYEKLQQENINLKSQITILKVELAHLKAADSNIKFGG